MSNILILDIGARNSLVRHFKKNKSDKIIVADCNKLAAALYEEVNYYIIPKCTENNYLDKLLEVCVLEKINMIIPLNEIDLMVLSENKSLFAKRGIVCMVPDFELVKLCSDKYEMARYLINKGYNTQYTYDSFNEFESNVLKDNVGFPVFMKPRFGCGSVGNVIVSNIDMAKEIFNKDEHMIAQPFVKGKEIGVDVYVDIISNEVVSIFLKEKIRMLGGETDKSISFKDHKLFELIEKFVLNTGLKGVLDIDVFKVDDEYYISEVNPRFGGGYLHAHECGVKFTELISNNAKGKANLKAIGNYEEGIAMMKYKVCKIIDTKSGGIYA